MDRVLKKYTTIPSQLYVERSADLQLRKIIEDMQRPGYVLVARQMGKTNLLINAKRTLENDKRLLVYVDLSNLYENEVDCYRNIINSIIEFNIDIFEEIEEKIAEIRRKGLPAHNEYLRSLIAILNHYKGDIIIILDEIDALKSVRYSDNIFAQIRSNYFSRTNFDVLERLTYVLSGVIEPTDLIKDKNKSPFNIGDKIYLDDFTEEEHNTFIYKSKLQVSKQISEEIFGWTNGNPRLTFDICSELESMILKGQEIDRKSIEKLIKKKYLTTFDLAPIDHIRELVKENKVIREAIKNIYSEKTDLISDEIKSKLYLYGIIDSKFYNGTNIKNKIIREALNEDWLRSIDSDKTFLTGLANYLNGLFEEAIEVLGYVIESSSDKNEIEKSHYYLGLSYYHLDNYTEAAKYFKYDYTDVLIKYDATAFYGISLLKFGDKQGLDILEEVIKDEKHNYAYHTALLNFAINTDDKNKALSMLEKLIISTDESKNSDESELKELKALSYFYQSNIYEFQGEFLVAIDKINSALVYAKIEDKPVLFYGKLLLKSKLGESLVDIRSELVNSIVEEKVKFSSKGKFPLIFDNVGIQKILNAVFDLIDYNPFLKLVDYISDNLLNSKEEFIDLAISSYENNDNDSTDMLMYIKDKYKSDLNNSQLINILRIMVNSAKDDKKYISSFNEYYALLQKDIDYGLREEDLSTLIVTGQKYTMLQMSSKAINICNFTESRIESLEDEQMKLYLVFFIFLRTNIFFSLGRNEDTLTSANKALDILNNIKDYKSANVDASAIITIKQNIDEIIRKTTINSANMSYNLKSLRNQVVKVRYENGKVAERKFKHVENDITLGKCVIVK
ncbi:hypothetical protein BAZ12_18585 [Elizabethkingia miricola]|uniref:Tetratricopeptide repeat protein n=1 Tax=Elizabethkingia miricola TaxID=172045 RepID=A0ABD4DJ37_ELIMR|nr:tetratricopeptide repeat protein [Elizabethkingia miricola]KUY17171.1 hypothetical protein ATB95_12385 [Elizabethkingia miricola]OPC72282.1 hypothetical protein BAZ13_06155 [Elizabethkingia miricola]OPC76023.1 hypothetical protein BAZ12_18585 [Elizabethkingia miricola]SPW31969.1 Uncharacterised protein [Elizabethkingia miricola]